MGGCGNPVGCVTVDRGSGHWVSTVGGSTRQLGLNGVGSGDSGAISVWFRCATVATFTCPTQVLGRLASVYMFKRQSSSASSDISSAHCKAKVAAAFLLLPV